MPRKNLHPGSREDPQVLEGKSFAVLSYLSILCIIPLILKKDNPLCPRAQQAGPCDFHRAGGGHDRVDPFRDVAASLGDVRLGGIRLHRHPAVLQGRLIRFPVISPIADKITL